MVRFFCFRNCLAQWLAIRSTCLSITLKLRKKARDHYVNGQNCPHHKLTSTLSENFVLANQTPEDAIQNVHARNRLKAIDENRYRVFHIIRCIEFCGHLESLLRGHKDSRFFDLVEPDHDEGALKAALRLRSECTDEKV